MKKEILLSGLLGGVVLFIWLIISTSLIPLNGDISQQISNDKEIHTILKDRINDSGIYWLPGHDGETQGLYPDYQNEPIFYIYYAGTTPSSMTILTIVEIFCILLSPVIAAWLLSRASQKILAKYSQRVLYVMILGLFLAVYGDLFSQKPLNLMLLSSINNLISWTLAGLVIAWRITPEKSTNMTSQA